MYRLPAPRPLAAVLVVLAAGAVGTVRGFAAEPNELMVLRGDEHLIQVGDLLDVRFFYTPNFNERVIVRPDGRIALPLAGEIRAAGMTPGELAELLNEKYSVSLVDPQIAVKVRSFGARVYVGGQVLRPREIVLERPLTVLQTIAIVDEFLDESRLKDVVLIRRNPDRTPYVRVLQLDKAIQGTDPTQDVFLQPYDIVYVPKSKAYDVGEIINKLIIENIPVTFGVNFSAQAPRGPIEDEE